MNLDMLSVNEHRFVPAEGLLQGVAMKLVLSFIILSLTVAAAFAQPNPDTLWTARIGGSGIDYCHAIQQTADGGYILAGQTNSYGDHAADAYAVKLDTAGNLQWYGTYGAYSENSTNQFTAVRQTSDQGYILAGVVSTGNWFDMYVVKTYDDGDTVWTRIFNDPHAVIDVWPFGVLQTSDGGYLIAGYAASALPTHSYICLIKTSANGDTVWTRFMRERESIAFESCEDIVPASDGGYVLVGHRNVEGSNNVDALLMKITETGGVEWGHFYGDEGYEVFHSVAQTADGGYILAGESYVDTAQSIDMYVVRVTSSGDTLWTRRFGGNSVDVAKSVYETEDGFIVGGKTRSYGAGNDDFYLMKLDANGEQLWSRTYGGSDYDWCDDMQRTSDGGYILGGSTGSFGALGYDVYVVKTGQDGAGGSCPLLCADAYPIAVGDTVNQCSFHEHGEQHWFQIQLPAGLYRCQLNGFGDPADYDLYSYPSCADPIPSECSSYAIGPEDFTCEITDNVELYVKAEAYAGPYGSYWLLISHVESAAEKEMRLPTEFALSAFPNPFNPVTRIVFVLPRTAPVRLSVYDISGRLVQTLLDTRVEAGRHEVNFDGQALPSGIYFVQMRTESFMQTHKLVLLK